MGSFSTKPRDPEIENFVQESIEKNRIVIFSKTNCPYCKMAKNVRFQLFIKILLIRSREKIFAAIRDVKC